MEKYVLIVAGGVGKRMGHAVPKQFLPLKGKPIILHTLDIFQKTYPAIQFVIVLPEDQIETWQELVADTSYDEIPIAIGGKERTHSVLSGLEYIPEGTLVGIHDAVRPFVSSETIQRTFQMAEEKGNAIPVISGTESLRIVDGESSKAVDRSVFRVVQTPQCFHTDLIKLAYQDLTNIHTDDASVLESTGQKIYLVEGNKENIKITESADLKMAEALLANHSDF